MTGCSWWMRSRGSASSTLRSRSQTSIVSGGQKWVRAGWGTGFLALSDRALERLTPVFSGFAGTDVDLPLDEVLPPAQDARAYAISNPSPIAEARLAGALEQIAAVGVDQIARRGEREGRKID